jgi:hypothetical protein
MNGHIRSKGKDMGGSGRGLFYRTRYGLDSCSAEMGETGTLVNKAMNLRDPRKSRNFMTSLAATDL